MDEQFITEAMLLELGVDLEGKDTPALLDNLNTTLQDRVGTAITETLEDDQFSTLLDLQESGSDEAIEQWLAANVPNLEAIVSEQATALLDELADS